MKKEKIMNTTNDQTEIQTIRLYREPREFANQDFYFATDYFDFFVAEERKINDTFCSIMNLSDDTLNQSGIATQSFTLYFSQNMYEEYEGSQASHYNGSPFKEKSQLNFLSIIQVHIMPEVLRRMEYEGSNKEHVLGYDTGIVLKPFFDDLYESVNHFCESHEDEDMVFRIYEVLSAGDLAIVIRSKYAKTSFELSSSIRKRVAGERETEKKLKRHNGPYIRHLHC